MKTGIELIAIERQEQIEKHGYTSELTKSHPEWYVYNQLARVAQLLSYLDTGVIAKVCPVEMAISFGSIENWDEDRLRYMADKPYKERLIIAGALIAAEIDRLQDL